MEKNKPKNQISELGMAAYLIITLGLLVYVLILGVGWMQDPFLGRFIEPNLKISPYQLFQVGNSGFSTLNAYEQITIEAINGEPVLNIKEFRQKITKFEPGSPFEILISSPNFESKIVNQPTKQNPRFDRGNLARENRFRSRRMENRKSIIHVLGKCSLQLSSIYEF